MSATGTPKPSSVLQTVELSLVNCRGLHVASWSNGQWRDVRHWKRIGVAPAPSFRWKRLQVLTPMSDFPMVDVLRVKALPEFKLWLRFSDASEGVYDLSGTVGGEGEMVVPLKAPAY